MSKRPCEHPVVVDQSPPVKRTKVGGSVGEALPIAPPSARSGGGAPDICACVDRGGCEQKFSIILRVIPKTFSGTVFSVRTTLVR